MTDLPLLDEFHFSEDCKRRRWGLSTKCLIMCHTRANNRGRWHLKSPSFVSVIVIISCSAESAESCSQADHQRAFVNPSLSSVTLIQNPPALHLHKTQRQIRLPRSWEVIQKSFKSVRFLPVCHGRDLDCWICIIVFPDSISHDAWRLSGSKNKLHDLDRDIDILQSCTIQWCRHMPC